MGVVNATPDSFSGDGILPTTGDIQAAVEQALRMEDEGADIIDVGGESTRPASVYPGAVPVAANDEISRVVPVIEALVDRLEIPISIDSRKAEVVVAALDVGAAMANDVSMLGDDDMARIVSSRAVPIVVSHIRIGGHQGDVVDDVYGDLSDAISRLKSAGVVASNFIVDPGFGFAKTAAQSMELLRRFGRFRDELGSAVLIGTSRKSFIGSVTGESVDDRRFGSAATVAWAIREGADIVRVHDVKETVRVVKMIDALSRQADPQPKRANDDA